MAFKPNEDIDIAAFGRPKLPTPPLSDNGENGSEDGGVTALGDLQIDGDGQDDGNVDIEEPDDEETSAKDVEPEDVKTEDDLQKSTVEEKPTRKRGRPKSTDKLPAAKAPKKPKPAPKDTKPKKEADSSNTTPQPPKRGRAAGTTLADTTFTPEQDAYLRELFTSGGDGKRLKRKEIHMAFEDRFQTGRSENTIRFRWYKLKEEAIVLSAEEETTLKNAIKTVETDKAQAVLDIYTQKGGESFTKLTQAFVWKKIAEWGTDGSGNGKKQSAGGGCKQEDGRDE
ncbi:hypothetical protein TWF696_001590 [Orbilia brochopaga]|uniref:Myb-like domain-containing protein n=1 Tax=Orbilia brochopaga TaxID=3140254 RepID=A0AAV9UBG8_9PEZI